MWAGRAIAMDDCGWYKLLFYIFASLFIAVSCWILIWCCLYEGFRPNDNQILNELDGMEVAARPQTGNPTACP